VVIGAADNLFVMLAALFIVGATTGPVSSSGNTAATACSTRNDRQKVASLDFFVSIAFMPVSIAIAGPLDAGTYPDDLHDRWNRPTSVSSSRLVGQGECAQLKGHIN
jgi:hypothetical protein